MKNLFAFRFDIDSEKCIKQGVPNLLGLADRLGVKFSFFFNIGRAVAPLSSFLNLFNRTDSTAAGHSLSALKKLGFYHFLRTALLNPYVGAANLDIITEASKRGHEVALHGGKNHAKWVEKITSWNETEILHQLTWAIDILKNRKIEITAFASPCWKGTNRLYSVLSDLNFAYVSDNPNYLSQEIPKVLSLPNVPVNMLGEPGHIAYIEHKRAQGMNNRQIVETFRMELKQLDKFATIFEHPYFAGTTELDLTEQLVREAINTGKSVVTFGHLAKASCGNSHNTGDGNADH